jgi:hypothetical protein
MSFTTTSADIVLSTEQLAHLAEKEWVIVQHNGQNVEIDTDNLDIDLNDLAAGEIAELPNGLVVSI